MPRKSLNVPKMKRRKFIRSMVASTPMLWAPFARADPRNVLRIGAIGVGGKGRSDLDQLARHGRLVAACDVNVRKLNHALKSYPEAREYNDYRKMISDWAGQMDAISISTPDHTHAHAIQLALKAGMNVFVQTPMTHTVWEAREMRILAKQTGAVTQVGLQGCAQNEFREGVEFLQSGKIGEIAEIHVWTNRPVWPQGPIITSRPDGTLSPNGLNWDAFLGPAPFRKYDPCYQPYNWRGWRDFGTGALGDAGIHLLNLPAMGCGLKTPSKVKCLLDAPFHKETYPGWGKVRFDFPLRSSGKMMPLYWYEGRVGQLSRERTGEPNLPPRGLFKGKVPSAQGCIIVGSKGIFYSASAFGTTWEVHLGNGWKSSKEIILPRSSLRRNGRGDSGMKEEFVQGMQINQSTLPLANFQYAGSLTEWALLGNVAMAVGGEFDWDDEQFSTGRTDANSFLRKSYRNGWEI